ncbi:hypothetical protein VOLCADRAFT_97402 [Volvox carteri f. nagariensis]|uniref:Uncharacterized protein n=1 Tax=Volvox carteri f. nagariensis TaxID=3068 RepID=D8UCN6_VOLCA|nr:uncharacterized protein VOLCADRAFT_97402 [Volvox carteri f. nagariensis]EFJ42582.1 hypothetical protein VOLCADRAFT_97402 [Volvox carteri f. nagariensis]|eukprot:XP_002956438.1 hypothetical protein VOLCADRAFT_97402 [Volvox carteri f. nagariensis]
MAGADEADYLELLVANSRIGEWVDRIRARGNPARQKQALLLLKQAVENRSTYAEEARQAGVVPLLTRLLGLTEDEEVLDACSAIIAACSGPMATAGKVSTFTYDNAVVHIREGALGDGLGAKVWMVAHMLCLELASNRELVAGRRVLELGSGCGVCGLAAAALGAGHVVLTDVEGPVLRNLRSCMHLNHTSLTKRSDGYGGAAVYSNTSTRVTGPAEVSTAVRYGKVRDSLATEAPALPSDAELFDEAEEVEDFDDMMSDMMAVDGARSGSGSGDGDEKNLRPQGLALETAWEVGNTSVRLLDWAESRSLLDSGVVLEELGPQSAGVAVAEARTAEEGSAGGTAAGGEADMPPAIPVWERFPVVIGSEVMYERVHAELVAAVLKHRLAPGGCAVLQCAVRELKVFEHFARECRRRALRYRHRHVDPVTLFNPATPGGGGSACPFEGILGRADEYEGGVLLMAIDHEDSPCMQWHRDDWEAGV